jgi:hypothetical protein
MLRRLLVAVAALSISTFFAAEGFAMANTHAAGHSKAATSMPGGWIYGWYLDAKGSFPMTALTLLMFAVRLGVMFGAGFGP